jgi:YVTN family beta-propeller protein
MREYRILGPLEARLGGAPVPLGGPKQRAVLALLLLDAGRVVPRDRLIAELWGETPPETASTSLHGYVSQLRKGLEPDRPPGTDHEVLRTRPPGYVLEPAPDELDLARFRALAADGRRRLEAGDARGSAEALAAALSLWRGPPLADLAGEPWAPEAIRLLDEERLRAEETRFDAELALGHHAEVVPELEAAVAREPLREGLRERLMLALYRSGRQAEALEAFRSGRRLLVDELGLETGAALRTLEAGILAHEQALAAPAAPVRADPAAPPPVAPRHRGPRRAALFSVALACLLAAAIVAAALGGGDDAPQPVRATPDSVALIDPASARVTATVPVGSTPTRVSVGEGAAWVLNSDDQTISRIDAGTRAVTTFSTGSTPSDLVAGADGLWVGHHTRIPGAQ